MIFSLKETRALAIGGTAGLGLRAGGVLGAVVGAAAGSYLADTAAERGKCLGVRVKASEGGQPRGFIYNCSSY